DDAVFVQCFDARELRRVREELGSRLALIQLVEDGRAWRELLTPEGLRGVARYARGLGPAYGQLARPARSGGWRLTPLRQHARAAGLLLHPYTFRRAGLPVYAEDL